MKIDDTYSINLIAANNENGIYGDIYYDFSECKREHSDGPIMFGYEIINNKTGKGACEENRMIDEWYDSVEEAFLAWKCCLNKNENKKKNNTKESLLNEIDKVKGLLSIVDLEAYVDDSDPTNPYIRLLDEQGVCDFDVDDEEDKMYSAEEIMRKVQWFFDDTYLDGEICCNCKYNFNSYAEAEKVARKTGYEVEANNIHELRKYYF